MCFEAPLSIIHVYSLGITNPERADNSTYSSMSSFFLFSFDFFLLHHHPHLYLDVHDVFCCSYSSMDTLWKGVLSCDSYNIDIGSSLYSDYLLFSFKTSWEVNTPCDFTY